MKLRDSSEYKTVSYKQVLANKWQSHMGVIQNEYFSNIKHDMRIASRTDYISSTWALIHRHPEMFKHDGWVYFTVKGKKYKVTATPY